MTPEQVTELLEAQRKAARIAKHLTMLQGIRDTMRRRLYLQDVPDDIRDGVKAAYLDWHKQREGGV